MEDLEFQVQRAWSLFLRVCLEENTLSQIFIHSFQCMLSVHSVSSTVPGTGMLVNMTDVVPVFLDLALQWRRQTKRQANK